MAQPLLIQSGTRRHVDLTLKRFGELRVVVPNMPSDEKVTIRSF